MRFLIVLGVAMAGVAVYLLLTSRQPKDVSYVPRPETPSTYIEREPDPPASPDLPLLQSISSRFTKTARLGDEQFPLSFTADLPERHDISHLDDGVSNGFFPPLASLAAEGDESAIEWLYLQVKRCRELPRLTPEIIDGNEVARRAFHRCENITEEQLAESVRYLGESGKRGDRPNAILYANAIRIESPEEARQVFSQLWNEGYVEGLKGLAWESLPHEIASLIVDIAHYDGLDGPIQMRKKQRFVDRLRELETSRPPYEFREALSEARELLRNPRCCRL